MTKKKIAVPKAAREKDGVKIIAVKMDDPGAALVRRSKGMATTSVSTDEVMRMTRGEN